MIRFRRIEIDKFVCFEHLVVEPSVDPDRPLTVIRAENGTGKTTLLRAILWGMYGEEALPGEPRTFPVHLADWHPDGDGMKTSVKIDFESDGSTRSNTQSREDSTRYQLIREVSTVSRASSQSSSLPFRREHERTQLMARERDGRWGPHEHGVGAVVAELLPIELRDFFVMDADQVVDFVGGSESKHMQRSEVIRKTTDALHSLLGIDVFKDTSERVEQLVRQFGATATRAIGDANLSELQTHLERRQAEHDDLVEKLSLDDRSKEDAIGQLRDCEDRLGDELAGIGRLEGLGRRQRQIETRLNELHRDHEEAVGRLCLGLESGDLLASLAMREIVRCYQFLKPLHEAGRIPQRHLTFVGELLDEGTCVCGQDLSTSNSHRKHVEDRLREGRANQGRSDYLGNLYDSVRSSIDPQRGTQWSARRKGLSNKIAHIAVEAKGLELERKEIEQKLGKIEHDKIQQLQAEKGILEEQIEKLNQSIGAAKDKLPEVDRDLESAKKKIEQRKRLEGVAKDQQNAEALGHRVHQMLDGAYANILTRQVDELSKRMNGLFAQMAENVSDDEIDSISERRATLRMITQVGVRQVGDGDSFEIFALNRHGRSMPPTEINGASRRVLALAFVLALCKESRTDAPLVADSLLNFMSGMVRRNTLRLTAMQSSQPILLLTNADLAAPSEIETVQQFAGATYALTAQWQAREAGSGGDVVNQTEAKSVSLLCACGPREYCDICEREGLANSPGWAQRI